MFSLIYYYFLSHFTYLCYFTSILQVNSINLTGKASCLWIKYLQFDFCLHQKPIVNPEFDFRLHKKPIVNQGLIPTHTKKQLW